MLIVWLSGRTSVAVHGTVAVLGLNDWGQGWPLCNVRPSSQLVIGLLLPSLGECVKYSGPVERKGSKHGTRWALASPTCHMELTLVGYKGRRLMLSIYRNIDWRPMVVFYSTSKMTSRSSEDQHTVLWLEKRFPLSTKTYLLCLCSYAQSAFCKRNFVSCNVLCEKPVSVAPLDCCQTKWGPTMYF